ncbi:MAG: hypothetical protein ABI881_15970, partial [Betaproteobacteria bacterium]
MDIVTVVVAWCGVWTFGVMLVLALRAPFEWAAPGEAAWTKGCGFFAGAFVLTLWMRALSAAGIAFGIVSIVLPLLLVAAGAGYLAHRRGTLRWPWLRAALVEAIRVHELAGWRRGIWFAIIAWLVLRYALLFVDVTLQPLYPWDAWIQWATKARVWFEFKRIVPFVDTAQWLAAQGAAYTDASPGYPATVPLWQVFSCVMLRRWDDVLMNIPWWMLGIALPVALYGALRRMRFDALGAMVGAALVATLPLVNVHVALAGYADLPMAAYFTLATLALLRAFATRDRGDAAIAVIFAVACPMIKTPGIVWLLTLAAPAVVLLMPRRGVRIVAVAFAVTLIVLLVLAQTSASVLGYQLHLEFSPPWNALFESLFMLGTWNILWYGVAAAAIIGARDWLKPGVAPLTMLVGAGVLFLFFVFAFTNARAWVESQTTVNRAVLHLAPLMLVWVMLVFREWAARHEAAPTLRHSRESGNP